MKFNYFHLMPWDRFPERVEPWPVANADFDPVVATDLYKTYIDTLLYAEDCQWDAVGCNEHYFRPYPTAISPRRSHATAEFDVCHSKS